MTDEELINKIKKHVEELDILIEEGLKRRMYTEIEYKFDKKLEQAFFSDKEYKIKLTITKNY
tara:strand:- start:10030 stop:10215 length:186 start_codon:yes stop_codon:yes gene_type:complete